MAVLEREEVTFKSNLALTPGCLWSTLEQVLDYESIPVKIMRKNYMIIRTPRSCLRRQGEQGGGREKGEGEKRATHTIIRLFVVHPHVHIRRHRYSRNAGDGRAAPLGTQRRSEEEKRLFQQEGTRWRLNFRRQPVNSLKRT
jgi:hypothetical protein